MNKNVYDVVIIGSGAAGLSAGLYAGRYQMKAVVIGEDFGGYTMKAGEIENYPGFEKIDGYQLMNNMKKQCENLGVEVVMKKIINIVKNGHCFMLTVEEEEYVANTVIMAMGAKRRQLNLPNEDKFTGKGVHYCVTCDGPFYKGKKIAMVGGGDGSVKGLNQVADYIEKGYLIVRESELKAEPINLERLQNYLGDKIEVLYENEVKKIIGENKLEKIILAKEYNGSTQLDIDGLFIEIGSVPNIELAEKVGVELDERGYIKSDNMMKTNVDGVFVAGDTVNHFGGFKQIVTASAMGAVAATSAYNDHKIHGDLCPIHAVPLSSEK